MKKSNALMLSYIIFLAITVVVKLRWKWEGLDQIALAASGAGLFFAFADLAGWYLSCALPYAEAFLTDVISIKESIEAIAKEKSEAKNNLGTAIGLLEPYVDRKPKLTEILQNCKTLYASADQREMDCKKLEKDAEMLKEKSEKHVKKVKRFAYVELLLACFGFLTFFTLTCFEGLVKIIGVYESDITVSAFIVIMLCYYLRDTVEEKTKQDCEKMKTETKARKEKMEELEEAELSKQLLEAAKNAVDRFNKTIQQKEEIENG